MNLIDIHVSNFRNFGSPGFTLNFERNTNLIIGPNNSGKSNILTFLSSLHTWLGNKEANPDEFDHLNGDASIPVSVTFRIAQENPPRDIFDITVDFSKAKRTISSKRLHALASQGHHGDGSFFNSYTGKIILQGGVVNADGFVQELAPHMIARDILPLIRKPLFISHARQATQHGTYSLNGAGIIPRLAEWKSPDIGAQANKKKFDRVLNFVRELLRNPELDLDVPSSRDKIIVDNAGLRLPLSRYGTGVEQLIIIAVAVLDQRDQWICIEEIESNLHPLLQKQLLSFLLTSPENRHWISTHSTSMLSRLSDVGVLRLYRAESNGHATAKQITTPKDAVSVLSDLGIRPSDLLQTNFVIWVEGPSDRIFINRCLALTAPKLIEGLHYSILFYGGKNLYHYSLKDDLNEAADDLISVLRVNQHAAVVIDSDIETLGDHINATKARVVEEAKQLDVMCWVTQGREIENYIPSSVWGKYVASIVGANVAFTLESTQKIEDVAVSVSPTGKSFHYERNKVAHMRGITAMLTDSDLGSLDLRKRLDELIRRINSAQ